MDEYGSGRSDGNRLKDDGAPFLKGRYQSLSLGADKQRTEVASKPLDVLPLPLIRTDVAILGPCFGWRVRAG